MRDDAASRGSAIEATVGVPRLTDGTVSSPIAFYEATPRIALDSIPKFIATPRATVVFGRDSVLPVTWKATGMGARPFRCASPFGPRGHHDLVVRSRSAPRRAGLFSGVVNVPISRLRSGSDRGVSRAGSADTVRSPVFIGFGEDLPIASFTEMVDYLRYFTSSTKLSALKMPRPHGPARGHFPCAKPIPFRRPACTGTARLFRAHRPGELRFREEGAADGCRIVARLRGTW